MAGETVASDHSSATPEEVEKNVQEEVKTIEQVTAKPFKESGEEKRPKVEESPTPVIPSAELEENIEDKKIDPPVEEVKKTDEEEKPKAEDSPSPVFPLAESEEKTEDNKTEPLAIEETKIDDNAVLDVSVESNTRAAEDPIPEQAIPSASEPVSDNDKSDPGKRLAVEIVEKRPTEESGVECVQEKAAVQSRIVDISESAFEVVEKKEEQVEALPIKESEAAVVKDVELTEESQKYETREAVSVVEEKPKEYPEVGEPVVEATVIGFKEIEEINKVEEEVIPADKVEDTNSLKEEQLTKEVPLVTESSINMTSTNQEAQNNKNELSKEEFVETGKTEAENEGEDMKIKEDGVTVVIEESNPPETKIVENASSSIPTSEVTEKSVEGENTSRDIKAEDAKIEDKREKNIVIQELNQPETIIAENASSSIPTTEITEKSLEGANTYRDIEAKDANIAVDDEKKVVIEELNQDEAKVAEDVISAIPVTEVTERASEGENTSRDIESVAEYGKESIKDCTVASVQTSKDGEIERKVNEATMTAVEEPIEEPKKSVVDVGGEENLQTGETKLENEEVHEIAKPDVPNTESKDGDDTKTSQDPPKEGVSVKSTHKQSNNIISKMKQSLLKAKKAILGKSSNSKTPSSETKGEVKIK